MRASAIASSGAGLRPFGHLGWGYDGRPEFLSRAGGHLADGVAAGQFVEYVGAGTVGQLQAEVRGLGPAAEEALEAGRVRVCAIEDFYAYAGGTDVVDPEVCVAERVAAVEAAIEDRYSGLRAVVDATSVANTPAQRDAFGCFEHLIDRQTNLLPLSAVCAYDIGKLGAEAVAEMACLHSLVDGKATSFRLHAAKEGDAHLALGGEVDAVAERTFDTTVRRTLPLVEAATVSIDGRQLEFIGHRGLLALERAATAGGRTVVLHGTSPVVAKVARLLALEAVRVEAS